MFSIFSGSLLNSSSCLITSGPGVEIPVVSPEEVDLVEGIV